MVAGEVKREVRLSRSRIDSKVGGTFIEVRTPLITLNPGRGPAVSHGKFDSFDRLINHISELSLSPVGGRRAIVALSYLYDAPPFSRPPRDRFNSRIMEAVESALAMGVESWQISMKIDQSKSSLIRYFKLDQQNRRRTFIRRFHRMT
jgi:sugar fermentation stimulation protein A